MGLWGIGNTILIFLAGLKGIPQQLYEAAEIDGAGWWPRFWNVTIPMLSPTIFFNLVTGLIGVFQYFDQSYVMTNGGPPIIQGNNIVGSTEFYMLKLYTDAFSHRLFGYAAAEAVVLFVFILVVTLLVIRSSAMWVFYEGSVVKGK
jgi:multiple sugar transport system permease protein